MKKKIKLSVILLTYNHEKYIANTLDSILSQKVNFEYELIVAEDCSTDSTRKIIERYRKKFNNIRLCFNKKNHGMIFNFYMSQYNCSDTKYIALLEGDDYWTNSNKLQEQVDFLDNNPKFVGCSHNTELFYEENERKIPMIDVKGKKKSSYNIIDLISGNCYFHTSSYVWRNIFKKGYPKEMLYHKSLTGDWFLSMLYARYGNIKYLNKIMSVYRITGKGMWSKMKPYEQSFKNIRGMFVYNKLLRYNYDEEFKRIWWACEDFIEKTPKNFETFLVLTKIKLLKKSIDVVANKKFFILFDRFENFCDKFLDYRIIRLKPYKYFFKFLILLGKVIDKIMRMFFQLCFNSFHFFDLNRYFTFYKVVIYKFFKIKLYKTKH